ncbi:MAG: hypothetical protein BroJett040_19010 [Oligoflexia bacterium]|nr:MAG: hypothetical protein BroJett040_19010 [Oligoflexia bacterium]
MNTYGGGQNHLVERCLQYSKYLGYLAMMLPAISISGWLLDVPLLAQVHPTLPAMVPNTAIALTLGALAVLLHREDSPIQKSSIVQSLIAITIFLVGFLTLCEYAFGWDLGIDQIFLSVTPTASQPFPGRPAPQTSFNFCLLGFALIAFHLKMFSINAGQASAILIGANALIAATGYIFKTTEFYGFPLYEPAVGMAIHTSASFILVAGALLLSRPREGMMTLLTSNTLSGAMTRKILISSLLIPLLVGSLTRLGVIAGWYSVDMQVSLFSVIIVGFILRATWSAAKQAERAEIDLAASEQKYRALTEDAYDSILMIDSDARIVMVNEQLLRKFGYTREEVVGQKIEFLIPERFRKTHVIKRNNYLKNARSQPMGINADFLGRKKDGTEFPVDITLSPITSSEGFRVSAIIRDITERKRQEDQHTFLSETTKILNETLDPQERIQRIANSIVPKIADVCIVATIEKNELVFGAAACRDASKLDLLKQVAPKAIQRRGLYGIQAAIESGKPILIENTEEIIQSDKSFDEDQLERIKTFGITSFVNLPMIVSGKIIGTISLAMTKDSGRSFSSSDLAFAEVISSRCATLIENARLYRTAQRAKLITDNLPAMIAYWDKDQKCQFANRAYIEWFGYDPEKLIGRPIWELLGPEIYRKNLPYILGALRGEVQRFERDLRPPAQSQIRHTSATYIPEIVDGKVLGFFVLVFDVTDLKNAQLTATSEKEKAQAAVKTREDVLGILSHDLRNPLTSISLIAQLLMMSKQIEITKLHDYASRIEKSVTQMKILINDLLDFAKIQAGTFSVDQYRENLSDIVLPIIEALKTQAEIKGQHLEINIDHGLPAISCDATRISQVFFNIIGNAIKFTPEGGSIRVIAADSPDGILVSISDTGPGIPTEHLPKVFDRFWQATDTKHLGSGLGLSIAKGIVEAHKTKIWAESELGKGTSFYFFIPLANEETKRKAKKSFPREAYNALDI